MAVSVTSSKSVWRLLAEVEVETNVSDSMKCEEGSEIDYFLSI